MANVADLRRFALTMPGAEEFRLLGSPAVRVNKKTFVSWWAPDKRAVMKLDRGHQVMLFEVWPKLFSPCHVGTGTWSYVEISKLDRPELKDPVTEAWKSVAPKKLLTAHFPKASRARRGEVF